MRKERIVLTNGCWDPLHYGHLLHLQTARKMGDVLVVSVTKDEFVNKGEGRPVFDEHERLAMVKALRCVDRTLLVCGSLEALKKVKPDIFVKGSEYMGKLLPEDDEFCYKHGIEIEFTREKSYSSTELLHHYDCVRAS